MMQTKTVIRFFMPVFFMAHFLTGSNAQNETRNWHFGLRSGLHFSDSNVLVSDTSRSGTRRAPFALSDTAGNLLFYGNYGKQSIAGTQYSGGIFNRNHELMPNGGLATEEAVRQGTLAFPVVGSPGLYYVVGLLYELTGLGGYLLKYNVVDMTQENGLGAVTVKNMPVNSEIMDSGLSATIAADRRGYWLACRRWIGYLGANSYSFDLNIYLVDSSGFNLVSTRKDTSSLDQHFLKFSPDGRYLHFGDRLYYFNNQTGQTEGYRSLKTGAPTVIHHDEVEFSADSKVMYAYNEGDLSSCLRQFDLESADLAGSVMVLEGSGLPTACTAAAKCAMQLAPDGKIYVFRQSNKQLYVIQHPNLIGPDCLYEASGLFLSSSELFWDFPNFSTDMLVPAPVVAVSEPLKPGAVKILPNPNAGFAELHFAKPCPPGTRMEIMDMAGRVYGVRDISGARVAVDATGLTPGVYLLRIGHSGGTTVLKMICL